jgi:hypothetical protein
MGPELKSVHVNICDTFPLQNDIKEADDVLPLLFNFALEYAIRKAHED